MNLRFDGPQDAAPKLILAHGAGAPMDSPFMERVACGLAEHEIGVVRFEFPYMAARRQVGARRPPDAPRKLEQCWHEVIETVGSPASLIIGGKSMGGRIASRIADAAGVRGLICLGYPFHPPGRPTRLRVAHLEQLATPTLIVQGTRDALGNRDEIAGYALSPAIRIEFLDDGDHSFKPRVRSGRTPEQNMQQALDAMLCFVSALQD